MQLQDFLGEFTEMLSQHLVDLENHDFERFPNLLRAMHGPLEDPSLNDMEDVFDENQEECQSDQDEEEEELEEGEREESDQNEEEQEEDEHEECHDQGEEKETKTSKKQKKPIQISQWTIAGMIILLGNLI